MITVDLLRLALDIESLGFAGRDAAVTRVVHAARVAGLSSVSINILADSNQPEVARMRAFGKIASGLSRVRDDQTVDHAA